MRGESSPFFRKKFNNEWANSKYQLLDRDRPHHDKKEEYIASAIQTRTKFLVLTFTLLRH